MSVPSRNNDQLRIPTDLSPVLSALHDPGLLVECCEQTKPMLLLADLTSDHQKVCGAIARLKQNPATRHVPVIGFGDQDSPELQKSSLEAGVTLIVSESALLNHLPECLDQALSLE